MVIIQTILGCVAAGLGIWYAGLGISAIKHLHDVNQIDKAVGWSLWWCLDIDRYDKEGKRLCRRGQLFALISIALWIVVYAAPWR